jgi:hypothetical protein
MSVYQEYDHEHDRKTYGAWFCKSDGMWYWFTRDWQEQGPYGSEEIAENARLRHKDFVVTPEEI